MIKEFLVYDWNSLLEKKFKYSDFWFMFSKKRVNNGLKITSMIRSDKKKIELSETLWFRFIFKIEP